VLLGALGILAVGVSLGFLGAGGTAIALPVLVYLAGMEPHSAVTFSLMLVGGVSLYGALLHGRKGFVRLPAALAFAPLGILGAAFGSSWSSMLSGRALLLMFSALLAVIATVMLLDNKSEAHLAGPRRWHWMAVAGFGIGALTGLLGIGGGFVIVPALVYFAGLSMRCAVATSLLVIAINSGAAVIRHAAQTPPDLRLALPLLACAAIGMTLGVWLSHRTEPGHLKKYFALFLLALAAFMAIRNI